MRRLFLCLLGTATALLCGCTQAHSSTIATVIAEQAFRAKIDTADMAARNGDSEGIEAALQGVENSPRYRDLTPETKHHVSQLLGMAAFQQGRWAAAHRISVKTTSSAEAESVDWSYRLQTAMQINDFADALIAFDQVRVIDSDYPREVPDDNISLMDEGFGTLSNASEARYRFEKFLEDKDWQPGEPMTPDFIRYHYAVELAERGEIGHAQAVARKLNQGDAEALVMADKRFDSLIDGPGDPSLVPQSFSRVLNARSEVAQLNPYSSSALAVLSSSYYDMGRYQDAVDTAEKSLTLSEGAAGVAAHQKAHDVEIFALIRLGRGNEALQRARFPPGDAEGYATSQPILLADVLVGLGRGKEALDVVGPLGFEDLRPSAQMSLASLKVCAAEQSGNAKISRSAFAFVTSYPWFSGEQSLRAYACRGDDEGAAAYVVRLLKDPDHRHLALESLQESLPLPHPLADEARLERLRHKLQHDPRVLAALAPVGRINHYDVYDLNRDH